jgi:acetyl-CoA C-acetyltransferase
MTVAINPIGAAPQISQNPVGYRMANLAGSAIIVLNTQTIAFSGFTLNDLSFVETYDCFTIAELMEYEAMGLAPAGQGARAVLEGWRAADGKLPENHSGGLTAKGHPIGATGVSMHVISAMQLTGTAPAMQLPRAGIGGVFNTGGAGVASYVSILEPMRG